MLIVYFVDMFEDCAFVDFVEVADFEKMSIGLVESGEIGYIFLTSKKES